ncbi:hypothetical protein HO133_002568 [Letharia lupina]|uniref:C2H2-type domain-containing protein n=1 Tax=Letharia lupina TaxID=560253 RepID=A0A8H6CC66_9LECA|nr:uncharacterized protein HO133_002568 [Letharia lupina]KAF6220888.1 hypothetical protein HO133_002568 [Letharia lupina]
MADSPDMSPLSSHGSSEFGDEVKVEDREQSTDTLPSHDTHLVPPAKRRRTGQYSHQSTPAPLHEIPEDLGDISSDTSGSVPVSPMGDKVMGFPEDEPYASVPSEQVTTCKWQDCQAGDLGNMDNLVQHLHDDHIGKNKKKYACEWDGCNRNSAQASGYALKAHMRSHTKEKPFYCQLPECDKAFTRSDALAKHMRTVHETEALRPSDPVPKNYSSIPPKPQRLKLIVNSKPRDEGNGDTEIDDDATIYSNTDAENEGLSAAPFEYPADVQFTEEELEMPSERLFKLLRRQIHWSEEDGSDLQDEIRSLEAKRKQEWIAKELVLANVMEAEIATAHDKGEHPETVQKLAEDLPLPMLPILGPLPWYRYAAGPPEMPPEMRSA